jgi:CubicO group peptidase (beta-lactamase class C family)
MHNSPFYLLLVLVLSATLCRAQTEVQRLAEQYLQPLPVGTELSIGILEADTIYHLGMRKTAAGLEVIDNQDALFEIGSLTKTFTAALVMKQVQAGRIALDAPIEAYLPVALPGNRNQGQFISVQHLITHTSGLAATPGPFNLPFLKAKVLCPKNPFRYVKARHYYRYLSKFTLDYEPGQAWAYNNAAYGLLGVMVARQSDRTWAEAVQQDLFEPLNMTDTYLRVPQSERHRLVPGITAKGKTARLWDMDFIDPAGTIKSTLNDMLRYAAAQLAAPNGGLEFLARTQDPLGYRIPLTNKTWADQRMGLGWWHCLEQPDKIFTWHGGATGGYTAFLGFSQAQHQAVVVLSNLSSSHPQGRADKDIPFAMRLGQKLMWLGF